MQTARQKENRKILWHLQTINSLNVRMEWRNAAIVCWSHTCIYHCLCLLNYHLLDYYQRTDTLMLLIVHALLWCSCGSALRAAASFAYKVTWTHFWGALHLDVPVSQWRQTGEVKDAQGQGELCYSEDEELRRGRACCDPQLGALMKWHDFNATHSFYYLKNGFHLTWNKSDIQD